MHGVFGIARTSGLSVPSIASRACVDAPAMIEMSSVAGFNPAALRPASTPVA